MGQKRTSHPRFRREGAVPRVELTDDDAEILRHVYRHRFIRADDLYRLFSDRSADRLSRRLTALYRAGFLDRPIAQIDRFKQGGSQSVVYGLDTAGARYLKETLGVPIGSADWKSRNRSYTRESLDHTLAVTHFLVDLEVACRARPDVSLIRFEDILANAPEATLANQHLAQIEPEIRSAVLGNAGTLVSFRVGAEDAPYLAREFQPTFGVEDLLQLPNRGIYVKQMIDATPSRPFSADTVSFDDLHAGHIAPPEIRSTLAEPTSNFF